MPPSRPRAEAIDVALDATSPILDILETALDLAPVPGLGLIPKALSALVDRVKEARANKESRNAFVDQVKALSTVVDGIVKRANATPTSNNGREDNRSKVADSIESSQEFQEGAKELLSTITELGKSVGELKGGPGFRGFLKGLLHVSKNGDVLSGMKDMLADAVQRFQLRGHIAVDKGIQHIRDLLKEAEENRMVNSIPRVSAGYRAQNVDQLKGDFTKGTRKGLFEELQLWFDGHFPEDGPKRFYFLSGGAGLGKSAIAHQLCTRLDDLDHRLDDSKHGSQVGASYFFIRGDGSLSSGHSLFPTLLHQLALSQPTLRPHIIVAVREYLQHGDQQNIGYACQYLLRKAFLNASMSTHPPVFLIIDGLDECKERDLLPKLLRSLLELARELPCLRIFVASRPEPHIMAVLTAPEACDVVHGRSLDDTLDELKGDVRLYLEETVPRIPSYAAFLRHNLSALERLSIRAAGVFIYARIAVRLLETYRDHPEEQFELLFSSGGAPWLSPLDALYLQVLRSAFPPAELRQAVPARRERLLSLLQIITLVSSDYSEVLRPSRIVLLGSGLSEDDVATMVDSLRSVLFINNGGQVTPLHATFREFLIDKDRCVDSLYHVDAAKGHTRLASACLAAFSAENVTEFLADLDSAVGGYVHYAVVAWSYHLRDAEPNTALENHLRTFLQGAPRAIHQRALSRLVRNSYFIALLIRNMAQFLKASRQATELCSGYAKFTAYSICWYLEVAQNPDTPLDQLNPDLNSAVQELSKIGGDFELRDVELDLVLQHTDMERYQAAHAALAREISQDARTRELWFPRQFMSTGSSKKTENKGREGGQGRLRRY